MSIDNAVVVTLVLAHMNNPAVASISIGASHRSPNAQPTLDVVKNMRMFFIVVSDRATPRDLSRSKHASDNIERHKHEAMTNAPIKRPISHSKDAPTDEQPGGVLMPLKLSCKSAVARNTNATDKGTDALCTLVTRPTTYGKKNRVI